MKFYFTNIVKSFFVCLLFTACSPEKPKYSVFQGDLFDDTHLHEIHINFASDNFWDTLVLNKKLKDSLEVNTYHKGNDYDLKESRRTTLQKEKRNRLN